MAGRFDQTHNVFVDGVVDVNASSHEAQLQHVMAGEHRGDGLCAVGDVDLFEYVDRHLLARVSDRGSDKKAIHLGFGQLVGAELIDRILRGDDDERLRHVIGGAVHGDLLLFHNLQQGGLGFRRSAVDFVSQYERCKDRPFAELELVVLLIVYSHTHYVRRQQIWRELDALEAGVDGIGQSPCQLGFTGAGIVFKQHMSTGQ